MRIAIVGAGALGLYYGALLQRSGEDVHFLLRHDYDAITRHGLKIFSINGDFVLPQVQGYRAPDQIGPADLVLVGLKTFANDSFSELIGPLMGEDTQILTLQNGLGNEEALAELFGRERIIGGVAFLCSNRGEPGEVHHLGAGRIVLGEYQRCDRERIERLAAIFVKAGVDCRTTDDLKRARWEKLVWNIPFNGLCALLQQPVNLVLAQEACRRLVRDIMLEVITAANAQGLERPISAGYADNMLEFTDNMGEYRPSMQIDREEGRQLELAAIFGAPLEYGRQQGIEMPRVEMLATLLEQATR
ncbi:MAG: 2-dehydropantoate 2-reductase [Desulfuromonadales bacterium GWD2_54_10]|nr:MAG: 2-dehydropantoate 2-reductase [Desulfuromonadales bacterium GWD2_54_10]